MAGLGSRRKHSRVRQGGDRCNLCGAFAPRALPGDTIVRPGRLSRRPIRWWLQWSFSIGGSPAALVRAGLYPGVIGILQILGRITPRVEDVYVVSAIPPRRSSRRADGLQEGGKERDSSMTSEASNLPRSIRDLDLLLESVREFCEPLRVTSQLR